MIVHPQQFGVDTEVENQYTLTNIESIRVGNIIVKHNGNYKVHCGEEGFPTGLISRVSRVQFSAPQPKYF
jgi:hypothetical protein